MRSHWACRHPEAAAPTQRAYPPPLPTSFATDDDMRSRNPSALLLLFTVSSSSALRLPPMARSRASEPRLAATTLDDKDIVAAVRVGGSNTVVKHGHDHRIFTP